VIVETRHTEQGDAPTFTHRLLRQRDAREVAVARTRWSRET
jgi:hypothetical protein